MKLNRSLALLTLLLVVLAGWWQNLFSQGPPVLPHPNVRVFLVAELTLSEARRTGGLLGVMPSRAGRVGEKWNLEDVIRTGSRSPLPESAPRWRGPLEHVGSLSQVPYPAWDRETVLIVGVPKVSGEANLVPVILWGEQRPPTRTRLLSSPSTRGTPGLLAATDLASFLAQDSIGAGQGLSGHRGGDSRDLAAQVAVWDAQHRALAYLKFVPWALAVLLVIGRVIGNRLAKGFAERPLDEMSISAQNLKIADFIARLVIVYPLGLLLVPVFGVREGWIYLGAAIVSGIFALNRNQDENRPAMGRRASAVSLVPRSRFWAKGLAWATVLLLVLDVLLGGWVSARTPLSYSPLEAARFYGIGNEAGGYLIGAALVLGAGDLLTTMVLGVATALLLGAPTLGANFGCFLASLIGFSVSAFLQIKKERRVWGALVLGAVALGAVLLLVKGSAQTHLGRAAASGREGRGEVFARKLAMNAHLTLTSPWALLLLVQGALLWKQKKSPALLAGTGAAWLLNDSGVVAAALLLLWHEKATKEKNKTPPPREATGAGGD